MPMEEKTIAEAARCYRAGHLGRAIEICEEILEEDPENADALHFLATVAHGKGELDEALAKVRQALQSRPTSVEYKNTEGVILASRGDRERALAVFNEILLVEPENVNALNNRGLTRLWTGHPKEAIADFSSVISINPALSRVHLNHAVALQEIGLLQEAAEALDAALAADPNDHEARVIRATVLLLQGRYKEGFSEYESRLHPSLGIAPAAKEPRWDGLLRPGASLLLYAEQGMGDAIQFVRYAPFIARQGMRVSVVVQPALAPLFRTMECMDTVYVYGESVPPHDFHLPLMSLPYLFDTQLETIPAHIPYLYVDQEKAKEWERRFSALDNVPRIGLCWKGSSQHATDAKRSISLRAFEPLKSHTNVRFVSLLNVSLAHEEKETAQQLNLIDVADELRDFSDTAALMANLDLIIAVDTAALHLAGALGRPVWGLIPFSPDWRWGMNGIETPWYPTMSLVRQPEHGDWKSVIENVSRAIEQSVNGYQGN